MVVHAPSSEPSQPLSKLQVKAWRVTLTASRAGDGLEMAVRILASDDVSITAAVTSVPKRRGQATQVRRHRPCLS